MNTILLVEDQFELARVGLSELQTNGYRTVHAGDGLAALAQVESAAPDLIVLDWMLPGLDGLEVLWRARRTGRGSDDAIHCSL